MVQIGGSGHLNPEIVIGTEQKKHLHAVIDIGDWDMDADTTKDVAHGLTLANLRSITATIRNDDGTVYYQLAGHDGNLLPAQVEYIDATNVRLIRKNGQQFDSADFDSTSYNRGWIHIWHETT